jgi:hypothetical protein
MSLQADVDKIKILYFVEIPQNRTGGIWIMDIKLEYKLQ